MGGSSNIEDCITHGPWGGSRGKDWVCMPQGFIKKITIVHAGVIDRIRFQSDCPITETQSFIFGGNGGEKTDTICIDYPNEYLTSIRGTLGQFGGFTVVTSLCFQTNQIRYGPYGSESGSSFSYDGKGGAIVGFHGRAGRYIDAIGIYVIPESHLLYQNSASENNSAPKVPGVGMVKEAGPWGGGGGKPWDDGVFSHVKQVRVSMKESLKVICGIQFEYVRRDGKCILSEMHGGSGGDETILVDFDIGVKEYLTGISGFYGPVEGCNGLKGITSIAFQTSKKMYGPFGKGSGEVGDVYFSSTSGGRVGGFHGRGGDFLTAIGVHMGYF